MYFWRRVTCSLSTHFTQMNEPLSSSFPPWEHFVKTQITPARFSLPGPMWIFSWPGHRICNSTTLPTTSMYRGTNTFLLLLEIPLLMHPQNTFTFFMAKEKATSVVHNHSEMKYCTTVFTTTFPILSSQNSIYYTAYIVYMLHMHCSMHFCN